MIYPQLLITVTYLAKNLKFLRQRMGLRQHEMQSQLGFTQSRWNQYETGKSKHVLDDFIKISDFFKVTASQLLEQDLTKGDFFKNSRSTEKHKKSDFEGDFEGDFSGKKGGKTEILTMAAEPQADLLTRAKNTLIITVDSRGDENVLYVPVKARAGYLNGYADPEFIQTLPAYRLPGLNNGSFRLFEVEGLSMYNTLNSGDLVIGSNVEQLRLIRDDRVHVVVTQSHGIVVKRVLNRIDKERKLILKSDNFKDRDLYPPIVVDPEDVLEVWYVTGFISRQLRPPGEIYNRVSDLEARLTILEDLNRKSSRKLT